MNKTDNISSFIQNCNDSLAKHFFLQTPKIEVHQDRDSISKVKYADTQFFTKIIFITSISPCET
jgi:plasmid replication initiation protein